uniref:Uncharacterized protein n=1 Tax=viral metagenome TaxID=1070528 RepID=A0A6M3LSR8_9ZZZZ
MNSIYWSQVVPPKKRSVTISPTYVAENKLQDDCIMAIIFNYPDELVKKLYIIAVPCERQELIDLFNNEKIYCRIENNGNLTIRN